MNDEPEVTTQPVNLVEDDLELASPEDIRAAQIVLAAQLATAEDRWRRAVADLDNHRKRMAREMDTAREQERQRAAKALLPVIDGLERAVEFTASADDGLISGIEAVRQQAVDALRDLGYPKIDAEGRAFDPRLHEVVSVTENDSLPPRTVVAVVRPGFGTPERVLRPAGVVVTPEREGN